ncbi:MAG: DUF1573 domain-containing protein [Planctomycetota bacterium]
MKIFFLILFGVISFGTVLGVVASNVSEKPYVPEGQLDAAEARIDAVREAVEARNNPNSEVAIAECVEDTYHFGLMDPLTVGKHTFFIENTGSSPLLLKGGESSCKCTLSDLDQAIVQPGDKYPVQLVWNSGHAKKSFKQLAVVHTNDSLNQEIRLTVMGEVRSVLTAMPSTINLNRLIPETPAEHQFVLYSQIWNELDIVKIESSIPQVTGTVSERDGKQSYARDDEIQNATAEKVIDISYDGTAPRGDLQGALFVHVRPPADWDTKRDAESELVAIAEDDGTRESLSPPAINLPVNQDGILICEIPFYGKVVRRLSLYGKVIGNEGSINLGKIHPRDVVDSNWTVVGRIRGEQLPDEIGVSVEGIPGLVAKVEKTSSSKANNSFRIQLTLTEKIAPKIFDGDQAGLLVLEAPGMPEEEARLELPINLTVINY